ncbi:protein NRT1/ PTR FAMILY 5.5-like [Bidens hawaiensis]|uniref:protein NRT1/ PTR FAMILY 5.5-like n=1 Tax=Bidens hawaiensis TaxID=980011 RepID=UPI00404929A7
MVNFLDALNMIHNATIVQTYALLMLMVYLTDVWGLGITHAACLINIWAGITKIMPLVFLFIMDNYIDTYSMLVFSTTTSALGMGILSISTPSWLYSLITGSCSEYKMKCISETQQIVFYFALVLIMIGRSGCDVIIETLDFKGNAIEQELMFNFVTSGTNFTAVQASFLLLTPWSFIFGFSAVYSSLAVYLLKGKSWSQRIYINNPERSPVTRVLRVFVATILRIPTEIKRRALPFRSSSSYRFLGNAAIRPSNDKGRQNRWTHCSVQEIEDAKTFVRMLPVGFMYAFLVLISTIFSTYILQQAKRLKPVSVFGLPLFNFSYIAWLYLNEEVRNKFKYNYTYKNKEMLGTLVIDAMINATVCCVIAALVETSRLGVIREHGLANKPGEIIPMSSVWMIPLFLMVGYFNSSLGPILQIFSDKDMPFPMRNFQVFVFEGFIGVGIMSSALVVCLVGKISQMGGRPSWFQHDTENSRLDLFYWALALLCVIVLTIWFQVTRYFKRRWYAKPRHFNV